MRLERAPTREAIVLGEVELGVGEFGAGLRLPQLLEPAFGLLAKPIEVGRVGKRRGRGPAVLLGHMTPSFLGKDASPFTPGVRSWARNRRLCWNNRGRVEPFTRTVGRPLGSWLIVWRDCESDKRMTRSTSRGRLQLVQLARQQHAKQLS